MVITIVALGDINEAGGQTVALATETFVTGLVVSVV